MANRKHCSNLFIFCRYLPHIWWLCRKRFFYGQEFDILDTDVLDFDILTWPTWRDAKLKPFERTSGISSIKSYTVSFKQMNFEIKVQLYISRHTLTKVVGCKNLCFLRSPKGKTKSPVNISLICWILLEKIAFKTCFVYKELYPWLALFSRTFFVKYWHVKYELLKNLLNLPATKFPFLLCIYH